MGYYAQSAADSREQPAPPATADRSGDRVKNPRARDEDHDERRQQELDGHARQRSRSGMTRQEPCLSNSTGGPCDPRLGGEGSIQAEIGWIYMCVWLAVAIGLVVFDWKAWRGPAPAPATTALLVPPGEATQAAHQ